METESVIFNVVNMERFFLGRITIALYSVLILMISKYFVEFLPELCTLLIRFLVFGIKALVLLGVLLLILSVMSPGTS